MEFLFYDIQRHRAEPGAIPNGIIPLYSVNGQVTHHPFRVLFLCHTDKHEAISENKYIRGKNFFLFFPQGRTSIH